MTFEGLNFDVLTGATAPLAAYLLTVRPHWRRPILLAWNVMGLVLLAAIVVISILSLPTPLRVFTNEPANTIVTRFPFIWLPGFLVPLAYTLHFFALKNLKARPLTGAWETRGGRAQPTRKMQDKAV
jgi:hypothetical protein